MKKYLYCVYILLGFVDRTVFCRRENYSTNNDVIYTERRDCSPQSVSTGEGPCNPIQSDVRFSEDENERNYRDRVFFPSDDDDYPSNNTPSPDTIETCMKECHANMDTNYDPVCGTNSVTYINLSQLECAMSCGIDVHIRQMSACPGWLETTTKRSPVLETEELKSCLLLCPTTQEYNPVCGTNDVTYYNYGKMFCAQVCGVDVQVKRRSPCPKPIKSSPEPIVATSSIRPYELSKEFLLCLQICPTTSEYDPVCGSNKKTYYNIAKLQCARNCGIDVTVLKRTSCFTEISTSLHTDDGPLNKETISQDILDRIFNNSEEDISSEY